MAEAGAPASSATRMLSPSHISLAISMGDPAGIGPEICSRTLARGLLPGGVTLMLVGSGSALRSASANGIGHLHPLSLEAEMGSIEPGKAYLVDLDSDAEAVKPGVPSAEGGRLSACYLDGALKLVRRGLAEGLVTAPISKEAWRLAEIEFPGHTEYLREATSSRRTEMMFWGGGFRVALFSSHVSLADAIAALNRGALADFIKFVVGELASLGVSGPRVAVAALNPHAGEKGIFGSEEREIIEPVVEECKRSGIDIRGPLPADSLFTPQARAEHDLVIALHHDQGLIPIKSIAFYSAVNVTLGLPFVRTSPAHGVAFDIAYKGIACPDGMAAAVATAAELTARRRALSPL